MGAIPQCDSEDDAGVPCVELGALHPTRSGAASIRVRTAARGMKRHCDEIPSRFIGFA